MFYFYSLFKMVQKKTIVLLHGFGEDSSIFKEQIKVLSPFFRVFSPDLPGSGQHINHHWQEGTETIEWLAHWVNVQLTEQQISSCIMLGHSMGGYITLAFAEKFPDKLEAFGLIHSTAFADSEVKKETRKKAIQFMEEKGGHTFLKTSIPGLFADAYSKNHPQIISGLVEQAKNFTVGSLTVYYKAMLARPDRTAVLKNTKVPVLLVAGSEDIAVPMPDLLQQASLPSTCYFHVLQQCGHMGMLEDAENLSKILLNFSMSI